MSSFLKNESLGNLISHIQTKQGLAGKTTCGCFRVIIFSESIFQITINKEDSFEDFSYSVALSPQPTDIEIKEDSLSIALSTSQGKLVISKSPVRFSFQSLDGFVINEDDSFGTSWIGEQVTTYKKLQHDERFIGLGEKTGPLDRKDSAYQNWNTDVYGYHNGTDPLYCSTPFYIGLHQGKVYGIFLDNTYKTYFNFGASNNRFTSFGADAGEMNYYFFFGETVPDIIKGYTHLTGRMEMPPIWSIGFQQCRYSYYPDKELVSVARTFREKDIPADVIVLDIHYMEKYKIFTWDNKNFSNPKAMIDDIKKQGFNIVIMCDPGIKVESGYEPYEDGVNKKIFITYPDGENYQGQVWPGWCHFPDFTNPKAREWWATKFQSYVDLGVEGFWNDMNEIATWGNALPENLEFDFEGNKATTRRGRNVFGFQMARSTYEGTKKLLKGRRPFNLTRSAFSGIQRYSAVWTGDNVSYDGHMMLGVRMVNSMGLTGIAFAGYDTGGFVGDCNTKLFARWISIAALSPFFRVHTMINTRDSEPWSYGEEVENISRNYIKFRYQLLPYLYSLYYEAAITGMPVQRSLAINFAHDPRVYDHQYHHQYLFGPFILVAPVESNKDLVKVFLPAGNWHYLYDCKKFSGNQEVIIDCPIHKLPVFVKEGAIIPTRKSAPTTQTETDELVLHFYNGSEATEFDFYEDDGVTFEYQKGNYLLRKIRFIAHERKITLEKASGNFTTVYKKLKMVFHYFDASTIKAGGKDWNLTTSTHSFFSPLEKYDPINDPDSMGEEIVKFVSMEYSADFMEITW